MGGMNDTIISFLLRKRYKKYGQYNKGYRLQGKLIESLGFYRWWGEVSWEDRVWEYRV